MECVWKQLAESPFIIAIAWEFWWTGAENPGSLHLYVQITTFLQLFLIANLLVQSQVIWSVNERALLNESVRLNARVEKQKRKKKSLPLDARVFIRSFET